MDKLTLDQSTVEKLRGLQAHTELCDEAGQRLGFFTPVVSSSAFLIDDPPTTEELDQIERAFHGRPLAESLQDLQANA